MIRDRRIVPGLVVMLVLSTISDGFTGLSFKLTRSTNDKFQNPTAKACNWQQENQKFCLDANSRCDRNCCQCTCDYSTSTFVKKVMKCKKNDAVRSGKFNFGSRLNCLQI